MPTERFGNLGYLGLVKEAVKGTPLTPTDYVPLYSESIQTSLNLIDQQPIFGNKFATFATIPGQRSHKGEITVLAEPNTSARFFDALLTKTSTTGAGPYTHTFGLVAGTDPNSYTYDISTGNIVARYFGVQVSKITPNWNKNELQWKISLSALGSFQGRTIATVATTTLTLDTTYDPTPTKGLVVGDLVRLYKTAGNVSADFTIATVNADGITITLSATAAAFATGDMIYLRPATTTFTIQPSFLWAKSLFGFGATASAALTNATQALQTRVEQGSTYELIHNFESDDGSGRSGAFDPAVLIRETGDATLTVKRFFDTPEDVANMNNITKTALVIRHVSGATNQYETRITFNNLKTDGKVVPDLNSGDIVYSEIKYHPDYDTSDAAGYGVVIINALATI